MSACASIACRIDSLTRNLAIMSHEGRAVVKSSANGYAGGCHPIRIVISDTTVDNRTMEVNGTLLVVYLVRRGPIPNQHPANRTHNPQLHTRPAT